MSQTFHAFALPSVSAGTFGSPAITGLSQDPMHVMLFNKHATAVVEYSHDGTTVHGELDPTDATAGQTLDDIRSGAGLWLRIKSGSTGPAVVFVKAWLSRSLVDRVGKALSAAAAAADAPVQVMFAPFKS